MSAKGSPKSVKTPRTLERGREQERQQDQLLEEARERILHAAARKIQKIYKNTKEFRRSRKEHQKNNLHPHSLLPHHPQRLVMQP